MSNIYNADDTHSDAALYGQEYEVYPDKDQANRPEYNYDENGVVRT